MAQRLLLRGILLLALFISEKNYGQLDKVKEEKLSKKILADPMVAAVKISSERQTPSLIVFAARSVTYPKDNAAFLLKEYLSVRPGLDELQTAKQTELPGNFQVVEFAQYYKGVKVEYGGFKVLAKDGGLLLMNGSWYELTSSVVTRPELSKENALLQAKAKVNAKKYATDFFREQLEKTSDPLIRQALSEELAAVTPKGELVIIKDFTKPGADMRLAWKFDIYATEPMSRSWIYVDAKDGRILFRDAIIKHALQRNCRRQAASHLATGLAPGFSTPLLEKRHWLYPRRHRQRAPSEDENIRRL